ncbi:hypothetical protein N0036_08380 [Pseudomonas aeruginosa]|uniref:hypothetical protein n=1 Tax=Pseudomonas aeruginosa TaxID=287 RepID=UPI0004485CC0|nr:hypothetical protein [Pseudomonas aeruginosa]EKN9355115.1 hypothetical protein [Pseudomonas aeruginosa]ETU92567.1 hypothetical protein Q094_02952 [Pseudomonas aeruginosa PS42]MBH3789994.1 hypothetical protein [Pseudomonas aeruginosa]MCS7675652.1 hypothetical protein [Pseudomonas aeruginosa]MCS7904959.1 hypothetical protein [Pseudomonas aeruginosa]
MSAPAIRPRPDQIGELTRGLHLPLPAVDALHLEIIAEGLSRAFADVRTHHPLAVSSGSEAEVTSLMEARLNALIGQDPFWGQLVTCVVRGKESVSFDGSHIEKRPDLSIYLSSRARNFPLIAEAKIIDTSAAKTEALYCDKGLHRFLAGEYAWASQEAFMVAYVRDGSSISDRLLPFLADAMTQAPPRYAVEVLPASCSSGTSDLAWSRHARSFVYSHQAPPAHHPGSIAIWHLWLS